MRPPSNTGRESLAPSPPLRRPFPLFQKTRWWERSCDTPTPITSLEKNQGFALAGWHLQKLCSHSEDSLCTRWNWISTKPLHTQTSPWQRGWLLSKTELSLPSRGHPRTGRHQSWPQCLEEMKLGSFTNSSWGSAMNHTLQDRAQHSPSRQPTAHKLVGNSLSTWISVSKVRPGFWQVEGSLL